MAPALPGVHDGAVWVLSLDRNRTCACRYCITRDGLVVIGFGKPVWLPNSRKRNRIEKGSGSALARCWRRPENGSLLKTCRSMEEGRPPFLWRPGCRTTAAPSPSPARTPSRWANSDSAPAPDRLRLRPRSRLVDSRTWPSVARTLPTAWAMTSPGGALHRPTVLCDLLQAALCPVNQINADRISLREESVMEPGDPLGRRGSALTPEPSSASVAAPR